MFQSEVKEAGGQIRPGGCRATAASRLFAQAGTDGEHAKKYGEEMKVIRCVVTFYSSFFPT